MQVSGQHKALCSIWRLQAATLFRGYSRDHSELAMIVYGPNQTDLPVRRIFATARVSANDKSIAGGESVGLTNSRLS